MSSSWAMSLSVWRGQGKKSVVRAASRGPRTPVVEELGHSHGSNKHWMTCNKWRIQDVGRACMIRAIGAITMIRVPQLWARSRDGGPVSYPVRGETERNPIKRSVAICDDVARACASTREVGEALQLIGPWSVRHSQKPRQLSRFSVLGWETHVLTKQNEGKNICATVTSKRGIQVDRP